MSTDITLLGSIFGNLYAIYIIYSLSPAIILYIAFLILRFIPTSIY